MKLTINIPDNATNGDVVLTMFPEVKADEFYMTVHTTTNVICDGVKGGISYDFWKEWWNAPYKGNLQKEQEEAPERPVKSYHEVDPTFTTGKKPSLKQIKEYIVDILKEEYERGYRDGKAEREVIEDDLK